MCVCVSVWWGVNKWQDRKGKGGLKKVKGGEEGRGLTQFVCA